MPLEPSGLGPCDGNVRRLLIGGATKRRRQAQATKETGSCPRWEQLIRWAD
jgi:hypothetical protein